MCAGPDKISTYLPVSTNLVLDLFSPLICQLVTDAETCMMASAAARVVHFSLDDVPVLTNAGIGVRGIKVDDKDKVLGIVQLARPSDCLRVKNTSDKLVSFGQQKYQVSSRGGRGVQTSKRIGFVEVIRPEIELIDWSTMEEDQA